MALRDDYQSDVSLDLASGQSRPLTLGKANVLHYRFIDGGFVMVRPSGPEPKLQLCFSVWGASADGAEQRLGAVKAAVLLERMGLA